MKVNLMLLSKASLDNCQILTGRYLSIKGEIKFSPLFILNFSLQ